VSKKDTRFFKILMKRNYQFQVNSKQSNQKLIF
jgi:hypothetical protein